MIEKDLQGLGFTLGEAKAYLTMLETGSSTVGPIAKKSGISYSKIYEVLQRLIEKGVVSFIVKGKTKYFTAIKPDLLYRFLDRQIIEIEKSKERLDEIVPELEKHVKSSEESHEAEIFVGFKGLRTAYEKMYHGLKKGEEGLFLYVTKKEFEKEVDDFYLTLAPYYKKIGIKFKGIGTKEWVKSDYPKQTKSFIETKWVDFPLPGNVDIFKDYLMQITWSKFKPIAVLIKNKEVAENYTNYFNEIWKIAKK